MSISPGSYVFPRGAAYDVRVAIRQQFQTEIESLRAGMVEMASVVLNQVERSVAAWHAVDAEAARAVIDGDERVDERCAELDQKIFNIQLLEAPVAGDQRLLHVGLIAVIALERVGDLAVAIANLTLAQRADGADPDVRALIQRMSARAVDTLAVAVQAIARGDVPVPLHASAEFQGACPDSAVVMLLSLDPSAEAA